MKVWLRSMFGLTLLLALGAGCGDTSAFAEARDIERKLVMANPEVTYADSGYLRVAAKLEQVPSSSSDYPKAQELLGHIHDARRIMLGEAYGLDYKPARLEGVSLASLKPVTEGVAPVQPQLVGEVVGGSEVAKVGSGGDQAAVVSPVILYSTSWCGYCRKARSYFQTNGIEFVEKDIEQDRTAAREMRQKVGGNSGVPVIDIDGKVIRGYDLRAIKQALARRDG